MDTKGVLPRKPIAYAVAALVNWAKGGAEPEGKKLVAIMQGRFQSLPYHVWFPPLASSSI